MRQATVEHIQALLAPARAPCISLYMPTHRHHPEREGDPIRFRNLLRELAASLAQKHDKREVEARMAPFEALAHDAEFWQHRTDSLAILADGDRFEVFDLQRPGRELVVVANSFHLKPLLRVLQSADRFQILAVGLGGGHLFEGNRDALDPVEVSAAIREPMGRESKQSHKDTSHADLLHYLRGIDSAVLEQHSRPGGLPLLLVALPEMASAFREASRNPQLLAAGLAIDGDALDPGALRARAWQVFEPQYLARLAALVETFESARAKGLGANLIEDVAAAAVAGRIATLLVDADREIPGRLDPATGAVAARALDDPEVDDLIDDIAETVLRARGEVVVAPAERMPGECGLAAILRY